MSRPSIIYLRLSLLLFVSVPWQAVAVVAPQEAWVTRWSLQDPHTTNRVVGMNADVAGHLLVAGDLTETNGGTRYVRLKYRPDGRLLWATNYASAGFPPNRLAAFDVDKEGNTVLTGTPDTVRFTADGHFAWFYGESGTDVAFTRDGDALVTGGSDTRFRTIKLTGAGLQTWTREEIDFPWYPFFTSFSRKVAVNDQGEAFVAGFEQFNALIVQGPWIPLCWMVVKKYDVFGERLWTYAYTGGEQHVFTRILYGLSAHPDGGAIVLGLYFGSGVTGDNVKFLDSHGNLAAPLGPFQPQITPEAYVVDGMGNVYAALEVNNPGLFPLSYLRIGKIGADGVRVWQRDFFDDDPERLGRYSRALALDDHGTVLVTGMLTGATTGGDVATLGYDTETGNLLWVRRYNGPANKEDEGRAIVIDAQGNVFVAGTSQNAAGGTDVVLIKYAAAPAVQRTEAGLRLQFPGPVGGPVDIEASADLTAWSALGTAITDPDGLARFTDTNAFSLPQRYYRPKRP